MQYFSSKYEFDYKMSHTKFQANSDDNNNDEDNNTKYYNNDTSSSNNKSDSDQSNKDNNNDHMFLQTEIKSENLKNCYNSYKELLKQDNKGSVLGKHLRDNDVEVL